VGDPVIRPTVRVLLMDAADRVLLLRAIPADDAPFWFPPGGGVEPGETELEAARRELVEETGWARPEIGPLLGHRRIVVTWSDGVTYDCRETWYWSRVEALEVDTSGWSEDERRDMDAVRWWTLAELDHADERLAPADLAERVRSIIDDGPPATPWALGC
jgi:ADP-ribose pyrophosphatase YjhB (NUDIX family)